MKSLLTFLVAFFGLTVMANAQCASGYTQLSGVYACQASSSFNVGYTTIPTGGVHTGGAGFTIANGSYTMPSTGTLQSISFYIPAAVSGNIILSLYQDNGSGVPSTLLAKTASTPAVSGWNTINTTTNPSVTSGTHVWISFLPLTNWQEDHPDTASGTAYYDTGGGSDTIPPSPFGAATNWGTFSYGLYATFH